MIIIAAGIALLFATSVIAGTPPAKETPKEATKAAPVQLHNQMMCPVMGGKIDSTVYADIQGQRVYFCCKGCPDKMKADPDKYFKKAAAEGVLFQNIQTTCPVSGDKLTDKTIYTDYEGRRIYFCSRKCLEDFNKDPQKYLTAMDKPSSGEAKPEGKENKTK
jgi:YHS domain-containing protein